MILGSNTVTIMGMKAIDRLLGKAISLTDSKYSGEYKDSVIHSLKMMKKYSDRGDFSMADNAAYALSLKLKRLLVHGGEMTNNSRLLRQLVSASGKIIWKLFLRSSIK